MGVGQTDAGVFRAWGWLGEGAGPQHSRLQVLVPAPVSLRQRAASGLMGRGGARAGPGCSRLQVRVGEGLEEMQGERSDALRQPLCCHQRPLLSSQGRSAWNCSFFQCCVFLLDHTLLWSFVHGTRALFCFNVAICRVVLMPEGLEGLSDCDERTRAALGVCVCVCVCVCVGVWGL